MPKKSISTINISFLLRGNLKTVSTKKLAIRIIYSICIITASLLPLLLNIKGITYNCYNAVDFSIYQQAVYDVLTLKEWNPYLTIRNINFLNDHFVPILYLAVLFTAVFGQGFLQLLIFEWLFFLGLIISILYIHRSNISKSIPYICCALTTNLLLMPLLYPIHPDTWSCLPLFWSTYFIVKNKIRILPALVFLTCLFKESFGFTFFPLGIFYVAKKEFKIGGAITIIASLFIFNELYLREYFFGPIMNYGDQFLKSFFNVSHLVSKVFLNTSIITFLLKLSPFILSFFFFLKNYNNKKLIVLKKVFPVLLIFTPLLLLQMYYNKNGQHYGSQFAGILIGAMVSFNVFHKISKKQKIFVLSLFILSSLEIYARYFNKLALSNYKNRCNIESEKIKDNKIIRSHVFQTSPSTTILASGGIIPFIMMSNKKIFHYGGFSQKRASYDYIILEKNNSGNIRPVTNKEIQNVILNCKNLAEEIYLDNKYFFFAKGKFENCVY